MTGEEIVRKSLRKVGKSENVTPATKMDELNADSLTLMEMTMEVEDTLGVKISDQEMEALQTVGDFIALVNRHIAQGGAGKSYGNPALGA